MRSAAVHYDQVGQAALRYVGEVATWGGEGGLMFGECLLPATSAS